MPIPVPSAVYLFFLHPFLPPKGISTHSLIWLIICLIFGSLQDLGEVETNDKVRLCRILTWAFELSLH